MAPKRLEALKASTAKAEADYKDARKQVHRFCHCLFVLHFRRSGMWLLVVIFTCEALRTCTQH
jgi:hypothetical protein